MTGRRTPIPRARVVRGIRCVRDVALIAATVVVLTGLAAVVTIYR